MALVSVFLAAGCSAAGEPKPAASSPSPSVAASGAGPMVSCSHDLGATAPGDGYQLVLDAVALPTATLVPEASGEPDWLFAKSGLVVRVNTPIDITVAPEAAARARIGWGSPGPEGTTIRVPACPSDSGWLAFAGGYTVRTPACVRLAVRARGREEGAGVSVGVAC